ncbi:DMT family transporter [Glycomyces tenuis]|uniref:DMT family transporter n=1 Tax=Glycomyces tenuis TaxID=58116 RepID=UPI0004084A79|nr:EamA family transporter [Glycomyces tenuis]
MALRHLGALRVAALAVLWGSSFLWIKIGLEAFSPIQITVLRMALGAAVLLSILRLRGLGLPAGWTTWGHLAVAALFGNAIPYLLFGIGEETVSSATAGVINASAPLWTVLFTVLAYRSGRSAKQNAWSLALGFAGVLLIFSPWRYGSEIASWGGLACLAAAASYGVSYVYIGHYLARRKLGSLSMAAGQLICATAITLIMVPILGWPSSQWDLGPILAICALGAFGTGIAYVLNYRIITDDGPTAASIVVYLLPVVAVVLGMVFLGEHPGIQVIAGLIIVLVGAKLRKANEQKIPEKAETFGQDSADTQNPNSLDQSPLPQLKLRSGTART